MRLPLFLRCTLLIAVSDAGLPVAANAAPGDLDVSFHGKGWATFLAGGDGARGMALQPDGRIVLVGMTFTQGSPFQLAVWRLHPDGTRDTSFNGSGEVVGSFIGPLPSSGLAVAVQSDGKILAAGGHIASPQSYLLARYLPDGRPDPAFGPGGRGFAVDFSGDGAAGSIALQQDGKILIGGGSGRVVRFLTDGSQDAAFGVGGVTPGPPTHPVTALAVQADGKILVAKDGAFTITRLLPNGTPDASFGTGGTATFTFVSADGSAVAQQLAVLPDNKILAAGGFADPAGDESGFILARLLADGTVDHTFGSAGTGRAKSSFGAELFAKVAALRLQTDGRILLAGHAFGDSVAADITLARFTADGVADAAFGDAGQVRTDLGFTGDECRAAVLVSDQKLLVAGRMTGSPDLSAGDLLLARYQTPPELALAVEYPEGVALNPLPGAPLDIGPVTAATRVIPLRLHNTGSAALAGLSAVLTDESHPGEFLVSAPAAASLAGGAETTLQLSLTPGAAAGERTATLRLTATTPGLQPLAIGLTGSRATPLEVWRVTWFGAPGSAGPGADLNDFDGDGLVNFMEYATGGNPHQPAAASCRAEAGGTFAYQRPEAALAEFSYQPERAENPAGVWSAEGLTSEVVTTESGLQTVRVTAAETTARSFFRLRVTRR